MTGFLFQLARLSADLSALFSGKAGRRVKNKAIGRGLARGGFWSRLWR